MAAWVVVVLSISMLVRWPIVACRLWRSRSCGTGFGHDIISPPDVTIVPVNASVCLELAQVCVAASLDGNHILARVGHLDQGTISWKNF